MERELDSAQPLLNGGAVRPRRISLPGQREAARVAKVRAARKDIIRTHAAARRLRVASEEI